MSKNVLIIILALVFVGLLIVSFSSYTDLQRVDEIVENKKELVEKLEYAAQQQEQVAKQSKSQSLVYLRQASELESKLIDCK